MREPRYLREVLIHTAALSPGDDRGAVVDEEEVDESLRRLCLNLPPRVGSGVSLAASLHCFSDLEVSLQTQHPALH